MTFVFIAIFFRAGFTAPAARFPRAGGSQKSPAGPVRLFRQMFQTRRCPDQTPGTGLAIGPGLVQGMI